MLLLSSICFPRKGVSMRQVRKFLGSFAAILVLITMANHAQGRPPRESRDPQSLAVPTPENARKLLRTLTAEPHVAGTQADYKTAVFVRDKLREWGWKADLEELEVLLNYPLIS